MSQFKSTTFASAAASGTDWRDTAKAVLEKLEDIRGEDGLFNLGFLYVSDHLTDDVTSILNLFRSVLGVENWVGCVGVGVFGADEVFMDKPAIAAMVGQFPKTAFQVFSHEGDREEKIKNWLSRTIPMMALVHGDPTAAQHPQISLAMLEQESAGFLVGGLASSRGTHLQIANTTIENTLSGVFFSQDVAVATTLSQGCEPISEFYTVTKADDNVILELDDQRALTVFQNALRSAAAKKFGCDPQSLFAELSTIESSDQIPEEYKSLFKGQIHTAFQISRSDQKDYMVRDIIGIDPDEGTITVAHDVNIGDRLLFVERTDTSIPSDLTRSLLALRERTMIERGCFLPKGGLYISCVARAAGESESGQMNRELGLIREIIGNIPLAGFYASGEISNARLYAYTGVLVLFF